MKKICIQNLGLMVTEDCNLDCRHCLRGKKEKRVMSKEVIEATLNQIAYIHNLCLCGGEVTMHLEPLTNIIDTILKNKIIIDQITIVINGTIYTYEFIDALKRINEIIREKIWIGISYDKYHIEEIEKLGLKERYVDNVKRYLNTPFKVGFKELPNRVKLFNEGNASLLDPNLTVDLRPIDYAITYVAGNKHKLDLNGYCYIGPLLSISVDGNITECDASFENQKTKFNYGNVLTDSIEKIIKQKSPIYKPRVYNRKVKRIAYNYHHYNK